MLDVHVVVSEVHWSSCELLPVKSDIDRILKDFRIEIVQVRNLGDDLAILEVALGSHPHVLIVH